MSKSEEILEILYGKSGDSGLDGISGYLVDVLSDMTEKVFSEYSDEDMKEMIAATRKQDFPDFTIVWGDWLREYGEARAIQFD